MSWEIVDKASQVTGVLAFLPILYSAYTLFRNDRRKKAELKNVGNKRNGRSGVLIVECVRKHEESMRAQVKEYVLELEAFRGKKNEIQDYISEATFKGDLSKNDMDKIVKNIRVAVGKLQTKGVGEYHVFIRGPMLLAAAAGGILYNSHAAVFYQRVQGGTYERWGAINR